MIITELIGGLGNQMFQYAFGRYLSVKNNTDLKLDISGFDKYEGITKRKYELGVFNIFENFANEKDLKYFEKYDKNRLFKTLEKLKAGHQRKIIKEKSTLFDEKLLQIKGDSYLKGYWQSEKYFKSIENILREDFTFKKELSDKNLTISEEIKNTLSVSLHIRRGDYVYDAKTNSYHGICEPAYYFKSLDYISQRHKNLSLFVFSDEPDWVKENLKFNYTTNYVDFNTGENAFEDLRLMSLCKHNIIANSSFSWWAAWLNQNPDKIIITPKYWFKEIKTPDLKPESWIEMN